MPVNALAAFRTLNNDQKQVYAKYRHTKKTTEQVAQLLFQHRVAAWETQIKELLTGVGVTDRQVSLTNQAVRSRILKASRIDAGSISNTYNYELATFIKNSGPENPNAFVNAWRMVRANHKSEQITTWTVNTAKAEAAKEFFKKNRKYLPKNIGYARVVGPRAKEMICAGWMSRGKIPIDELLNNPPPYHLNCPHSIRYMVRKIPFWTRWRVEDKLWAGD